MNPMIQAVVTTLASGALALAPKLAEEAGKSVVGEAIKDAYGRLKGYIGGKYSKVTSDIAQLEEEPEDTDRQNMIAKGLQKAGADQDEQLSQLAQALLKAIQTNAPQIASGITVDLSDLKIGGSATVEHISDSVRLTTSDIKGDLNIRDVGFGGKSDPN